MSEKNTYRGGMTLEEFKAICRDLQKYRPVFEEPYMSPTFRTALDEAFREQFAKGTE